MKPWAWIWAFATLGAVGYCLWKDAVSFALGILAVAGLFAIGAISELMGFDSRKKKQ